MLVNSVAFWKTTYLILDHHSPLWVPPWKTCLLSWTPFHLESKTCLECQMKPSIVDYILLVTVFQIHGLETFETFETFVWILSLRKNVCSSIHLWRMQAGPAGILSHREVYSSIYNTLRQTFKCKSQVPIRLPVFATTTYTKPCIPWDVQYRSIMVSVFILTIKLGAKMVFHFTSVNLTKFAIF